MNESTLNNLNLNRLDTTADGERHPIKYYPFGYILLPFWRTRKKKDVYPHPLFTRTLP